jgi:hypothetical protein
MNNLYLKIKQILIYLYLRRGGMKYIGASIIMH